MYNNMIKARYNKLPTNIMSSKIRSKKGCPIINLIQHSTEVLSRAIRQEKEIVDIQIRKEVKLSVCR